MKFERAKTPEGRKIVLSEALGGGNKKKVEIIEELLTTIRILTEGKTVSQIHPTPSSKWQAEGKEDPHGNQYDIPRERLTLGDFTDDELANAVFLYGDRRPTLDDLLSGNAKPAIVYLTAAKERIRWLSRINNKLADKVKELTDSDTLTEKEK